MAESNVTAHRRIRKYDKSHAQIILRVREYFEKEKTAGKRIDVQHVVARTAAATGANQNIIVKIRTQEDVNNWEYAAGAALKYNSCRLVPENYKALIRRVLRELYSEKKKVPTIDMIFQRLARTTAADVQDLNIFAGETILPLDSSIWLWSRATLHRFMVSNGFVHGERVSHYEYTKNREDVVRMRSDYLQWVQKYRNEGYRVYYQDETWVFKNMTCTKIWRNTEEEEMEDIFKVPSGRGERSILSHIGCADTGLLSNCLLLFRGQKSNKDSDYHSEMNWDVFSSWCENTVFPEIKKTNAKSVVVLDRATYHTVLDDDDRYPVTSWNKSRLISAIDRWGGAPDDWVLTWKRKMKKASLLEQARAMYPAPKYKIQKIADKFETEDFSIKILFLPVAHPELNPIEMVWGKVKRNVASRNMTFQLSAVEEETRHQISLVMKEDFSKYYQHAMKEEQKYICINSSD